MASIHGVLLMVFSAVLFCDFVELVSEQPAKPSQQINPYVC